MIHSEWMNEDDEIETWANIDNIEADLRNLATVLSVALLPLLDDPTNTTPELAECYADAETHIMKKLFPR